MGSDEEIAKHAVGPSSPSSPSSLQSPNQRGPMVSMQSPNASGYPPSQDPRPSGTTEEASLSPKAKLAASPKASRAPAPAVATPVRKRPRPEPSNVPIPRSEDKGCIIWDVTLKKDEEGERYGFSYASRRDDAPLDSNSPSPAADAMAAGEVLIVKGLMADGCMFDWNIEHPDAHVRVGDRIVEVNGKTTVAEMKEALKEDTIVMKMRRYPNVFQVDLTKTEAQPRLGFKFERPTVGNPNADAIGYLRVTEVTPGGLMEESNKRSLSAGLPHFVVTAGMGIEAVNDVQGNTDSLAEELRTCTTARLRIRRRPV